jgi:3',5'-cyclic AMP phosphodiesterase CpdA
MLGDNLYGYESANDFVRKFEKPYASLLTSGVKFYASLGNHDDPNQRFYKPFNMNGERYYTFSPRPGIRFFALDSTLMDRRQLAWLDEQLGASGADWKVCYFHHPLYSSGARHGADVALRRVLEPIFLKHGVDVVFAGHEHFYERVRPQKGIAYFTNGGAAKLREGNIRTSPLTAQGFDTDRSFMLVEFAGDEMHFQAISRVGRTVDAGSIKQAPEQTP